MAYYTYAEAIKQAMNEMGDDAVVMTGGYDQLIDVHLDEGAEGDEQEVYMEESEEWHDDGEDYETAPVLAISGVRDDGLIDTGEYLARVIRYADYKRLYKHDYF